MNKIPYCSPNSLGVDEKKLQRAHLLVADAVEKGETPGAVYLVLFKKHIIAHYALGLRSLQPIKTPVKLDTIYDLASLSKCVGTTTMALMLLEQGLIRLDDSVTYFFPDLAEKKGQIRIRHLLTHTSGLPAWAPIYKQASCREDWLQALKEIQLENPTGTKVIYSCLGFILLGLILEKVAGETLDSFLQRELFTPLGMQDTMYNIGASERVAPTEYSEERNGVILGEVHDENAFSLGGVSGNAGLFSTANDLATFAAMLLEGGYWEGKRYLSPRTIELMHQNHTASLNDNRGLGWALKGEYSSGGDLLSPNSFGHTGFTGTSLWIDPSYDLAIILLTNRVHPTRENGSGIIRLRALLANAVVASLPK